MLSRIIWKYFVRHWARSQGFADPLLLLGRLDSFSQPSEVMFPTELLRSTAVLHVRGLLNAQAIQHNLDWVWPYWVRKQFDPRSNSFIPRAFSLTHINLTHRNWTAVGLPDVEATPLVDPRGLVTPLWDGWSIDAWVIDRDGREIIPSHMHNVDQRALYDDRFRVVTKCDIKGMQLVSTVEMVRTGDKFVCRIVLEANSESTGSQLVVSLRPYNPEGVSLVKSISVTEDSLGWVINDKQHVHFDVPPFKHMLSDYRKGDVYAHLNDVAHEQRSVICHVEMANAAAVFPLEAATPRTVTVDILLHEPVFQPRPALSDRTVWQEHLEGACTLNIPDKHYQYLYEAALRTLLIHTSSNVYAGPFIYKRFWFRDAVFITHALLCCGFHARAERIINQFSHRQRVNGLFESQEGEWDSNGQVLWIIEKYCQMTGKPVKEEWQKMIQKGAEWIVRKRLPDNDGLHSGLMPSGFSAEHFGPNDYYYWDDFWSVSGLHAAVNLIAQWKGPKDTEIFAIEADKLESCIKKSLEHVAQATGDLAMPSSPHRRLDSACVGSLACGYPLGLWEGKDSRLLQTAEYLMKNCLVDNGFFHDMNHSGINPYLTLHIAQVLLRVGDPRYLLLIDRIAFLASSTGQWPEAVHPRTGGGCMGDGQHVWAAAEWIMIMRNCFAREEHGGRLILCSGLPPEWFKVPVDISMGPMWTSFGAITLHVTADMINVTIAWEAKWHTSPPEIEVHFPGVPVIHTNSKERSVSFGLPQSPNFPV